MKNVLINVKNLYMDYAGVAALNDINFKIQKGEVVSILGASGCGKTTLLRCLLGLEKISKGTIDILGFRFYDGNQESGIDNLRKRIGFVSQHLYLWPHKTVIDNVMLGPILSLKRNKSEAHKIAMSLLKQLGMLGFERKFPNELSGGQQQKVAIARALSTGSEILFLDETTSALDPEMVRNLAEHIKTLSNKGITIIAATHNIEFSKAISDSIIFLKYGSVVENTSASKFFLKSKKESVNRFLGKI